MFKLPKRYNSKETEKKHQSFWKEKKIYQWTDDLPRDKTFVIDTPPPTVSGLLHMGHIFSYTQADFVARFKRMKGFDVFYPMGFDDNGLPTERLVEKIIGKKAGIFEAENGQGSFVAKCREVVFEAEKEFESMFNTIALSVDWDQKYQTISPESQKISQASFIDLFNKGLVEKKFEPVFWDIADRTALAQADLVDKEIDGMMNEIEFSICDYSPLEGESKSNSSLVGGYKEPIKIMTTRPELLPACVAVMIHPEDARYQHLFKNNNFNNQGLTGSYAITPLFGVRVPIIADDLVQMDKGTGAVMCCTFGDETDIKWWRKWDLELRVIIGEDGTILPVYVTANWDGEAISQFNVGSVFSKTKGSNLTVTKSNCLDVQLFKQEYEGIASKKLKEAKEIIIAKLKATPRCSYPPLEGGSFASRMGRGQELTKATRFYSKETLNRAKELRQNITDAERFLWHYLRNKQLDGYKFRRQHPIDKYIIDFVCLETNLIIELDGGQHGEKDKIQYDASRTKFLEGLGYKVLRFWNNEIFENIFEILDVIWRELNNCSQLKHCDPSPFVSQMTLPQGEGKNTEPKITQNSSIYDAKSQHYDEKNKSILLKQTPIKHSVKCAERSGMPIEILVTNQWFIKILDKKEQLKAKAKECNWYPEYMRIRIEQWIDGLSWDWCISRQRFFGVAFPVWYSKRKGEEDKILIATIDQLQKATEQNRAFDPKIDLPIDPANKNGTGFYARDEIYPETDIMDTWATSSISPQLSSKGISEEICFDEQRHNKLFPADLRPQAHEIIRSWAFYTIVKSMLHQDKIPWKNLMISGWCLAADKTKMSKSKGNVVTPQFLIEDKGADVVRYWASTSHLGADTAYSEELFKIGNKLITKLFNAAKFVSQNFSALDKTPTFPYKDVTNNIINEKADLWILSRLQQTIVKVEEEFEQFEYAKARQAIEDFFWNDFCDNYLEIVKVRSYGLEAIKYQDINLSDNKKIKIIIQQQSGLFTLYHCLENLLKLFSPFIPHITEELYQAIFPDKLQSIHQRGSWCKIDEQILDDNALKIGTLMLEEIFKVRKFKSDNNLSMKAPLEDWGIGEGVDDVLEDLKNVCNISCTK